MIKYLTNKKEREMRPLNRQRNPNRLRSTTYLVDK